MVLLSTAIVLTMIMSAEAWIIGFKDGRLLKIADIIERRNYVEGRLRCIDRSESSHYLAALHSSTGGFPRYDGLNNPLEPYLRVKFDLDISRLNRISFEIMQISYPSQFRSTPIPRYSYVAAITHNDKEMLPPNDNFLTLGSTPNATASGPVQQLSSVRMARCRRIHNQNCVEGGPYLEEDAPSTLVETDLFWVRETVTSGIFDVKPVLTQADGTVVDLQVFYEPIKKAYRMAPDISAYEAHQKQGVHPCVLQFIQEN